MSNFTVSLFTPWNGMQPYEMAEFDTYLEALDWAEAMVEKAYVVQSGESQETCWEYAYEDIDENDLNNFVVKIEASKDYKLTPLEVCFEDCNQSTAYWEPLQEEIEDLIKAYEHLLYKMI